MTRQWDDPRIRAGMKSQLELRRRMIDEGARPIGWKVGFGAPAARERLSTTAPLVGFLTDATVLQSGAAVSIGGWTRPVVEPEVAVHMAADLGEGADRDAVRAAIGGLGPAIELADVDLEPLEVEPILAGNLFHRGLVLGRPDHGRAGGRLEGLTARVRSDEAEVAATSDLEVLTGDIVSIVGLVADLLKAAGERLRAGDVIIAGSVIPPIPGVDPAEITFQLEPCDPIRVRLE
ncbi:MAG: 2-keto-4-pentenoate hydratase [Acidimicrobiia bacterium]